MSALRGVYAGLFWLIGAAIVVQFFLAGWGVFAWAGLPPFDAHRGLGDLIGLLILLGIPLAFAAKVPWRVTYMNIGLFVLMIVQSFLAVADPANTKGAGDFQHGVAALHVVNGVLVFLGTLALNREVMIWMRRLRVSGSAPAAAQPAKTS